ncbi:MAG: hypothetical protein H6R18_492 [Proteobacteria bacterium]|nr:hypothetical protein [Pseudomonadota bacterium]
MRPKSCLIWLVASLMLATRVLAADLPQCLQRAPGQTTRSAMDKIHPADEELLARLVYAEASSTGFADDKRIYQGIAWGVMNRVRLGEISASASRQYGRGVSGVIFKPGQFNPAVSRRSPYSKEFLCPKDVARWQYALGGSRVALRGQDNPLTQTPWEQRYGLSLVVNFYYPMSSQARGVFAPWEGSRSLRFIGEPSHPGLPPAEQIRFYRLTQPPADLRNVSR